MPIQMAFTDLGSGPPLVILHGLFGCKENWGYLARQLAYRFRVITLDLRNHGESPHSEQSDYPSMSDDLLAFLDDLGLERIHLLGHSMGGKVAMQFAAHHSSRLFSLTIEDIGPHTYPPYHEKLFAILEQLPLSRLTSRTDADHRLRSAVPELAVRRFLLKNLYKTETGFAWRFNLPVLKRNYPHLIAALDIPKPIEAPALFLRGDQSTYLPAVLPEESTRLFRKVGMETIRGAGHWVHAEQPELFLQTFLAFLTGAEDR